MKLKEILDTIKLQGRDNIFVWYNNPKEKTITNINSYHWKHYYECNVNSYKVYNNCMWTDPFSGRSGYCKQYSIEIDWNEVIIVKSRIYK